MQYLRVLVFLSKMTLLMHGGIGVNCRVPPRGNEEHMDGQTSRAEPRWLKPWPAVCAHLGFVLFSRCV